MRPSFTTLRFRLMASFSIIIIACILLTSTLGAYYYSRTIGEQNMDYTLQMMRQVQNSADFYVRSAEQAISVLSSDKTLLSYMRLEEGDEFLRLSLETDLRQLLSSYTKQLPQINGVLVACENGRYLSNDFYRVTRDSLSLEHWYQSAVNSLGNRQITARPIQRNLRNWKNYSSYDVIMLAKSVVDPETGQILGVIMLDLRLDDIADILSELTLGTKGTIFLLDGAGDMVYTPINPLVYRVRTEWFDSQNSKSGQFFAPVAGESMTFLYSESTYTGWKTVGMFLRDSTPESVRILRRITALVAVLTLAFGILTALILTSTITRPLSNLQKLMLEAQDGNLNVHYQGGTSYDVDMLGNSFNAMIDKLNHLLAVVVAEQRDKRKAEINALQEQIKPHFLYNTLDNISWMAKEYGAVDIVEMISNLTSLFRITLSKGEEFITLEKELLQAKNYLYIQKVRYEEKLAFSFAVEPGLADVPILKLILQPLIENAIYHGIKPAPGSGSVEIRIRREGADMCIAVCNDGLGMDPAAMEHLNDSLKKREKRAGFGLFNVNERLFLHFGEGYGVQLRQNEAGGVTCVVWHPIRRKNKLPGKKGEQINV